MLVPSVQEPTEPPPTVSWICSLPATPLARTTMVLVALDPAPFPPTGGRHEKTSRPSAMIMKSFFDIDFPLFLPGAGCGVGQGTFRFITKPMMNFLYSMFDIEVLALMLTLNTFFTHRADRSGIDKIFEIKMSECRTQKPILRLSYCP